MTHPRLSVSLLTTVSLLASARVGHAAESPPAGAATSGGEAPPAGAASVGRVVGHVITVRVRKPVPGAIMRIRENGFETATGDVFNATRKSMDFGGGYKISSHLAVYFNAKNFRNTPHALYQGTPDRPIQREFYQQAYQMGVRFDY